MRRRWIGLIVAVLLLQVTALGGARLLADNDDAAALDPMTALGLRPLITPTGQVISPAGELVHWGNPALENHAFDIALSPNGTYAAVLGRFDLALIDTRTGRLTSAFALDSKTQGIGTYQGIVWSRSGDRFYVPTQIGADVPAKDGDNGLILEVTVDSGKISGVKPIATFPPKDGHLPIPNGLALSDDGTTLFVALSGQDLVGMVDLASGRVMTASAPHYPYGIAVANGKLYVTQWGGRLPADGDPTAPGGWNDYTFTLQQPLVVDPKSEAVNSGTVTVFTITAGQGLQPAGVITVGLHPEAITRSPDGAFVYVADANSDTISVIDTRTDKVSETIPASLQGVPYGASPNGLAVSPDGKRLFIADGMLNAVAVVALGKNASSTGSDPTSLVLGYIPTAQYPAGLAVDQKGQRLFVADLEGLGPYATTDDPNDKAFQSSLPSILTGKPFSAAGAYNAHRQLAYVSLITLPDTKTLQQYTEVVLANTHYTRALEAQKALSLPPRPNVAPKPIPERLGEPSVFKHVILIVKENRTYDQVLGDMPEGNGDPYLCVFGESITPNEHALAREFALFDNYYLPAKSSAEGHPWAATAYNTDWIEKNVRAWFRGYPHTILDAMVPPSTGFIWDDVLNHGKTFRSYGFSTLPVLDNPNLTWTDLWQLRQRGQMPPGLRVRGTIANLVANSHPQYPGEDYRFSDQFRADLFLADLQRFEQTGQMPDFILMALPTDHTAGTKPGFPTPQAMVADNDLALGRIIEGISQSRFWMDTAIFVIEDDAQDGWDHVSPFRAPVFVISAYSRLGHPIHTFYTELDLLRTIEQILGIPPLNLLDMGGRLMTDAFTTTPDPRPFVHRPNQIALDTMNPTPQNATGPALHWAQLGEQMPAVVDDPANDDLLNHMIWASTKGYDTPYPAVAHVVLPARTRDADD